MVLVGVGDSLFLLYFVYLSRGLRGVVGLGWSWECFACFDVCGDYRIVEIRISLVKLLLWLFFFRFLVVFWGFFV